MEIHGSITGIAQHHVLQRAVPDLGQRELQRIRIHDDDPGPDERGSSFEEETPNLVGVKVEGDVER